MPEFEPIATASVLAQQDAHEVSCGYWAAMAGEPAPGSDKSRGFHHGYGNGLVMRGDATPSPEAAALSRDYYGEASQCLH